VPAALARLRREGRTDTGPTQAGRFMSIRCPRVRASKGLPDAVARDDGGGRKRDLPTSAVVRRPSGRFIAPLTHPRRLNAASSRVTRAVTVATPSCRYGLRWLRRTFRDSRSAFSAAWSSLEILVDVHGAVPPACVLRGVREDVQVRSVAAVRRWPFEPARLCRSPPAPPAHRRGHDNHRAYRS